jgi:TPR repeat protein
LKAFVLVLVLFGLLAACGGNPKESETAAALKEIATKQKDQLELAAENGDVQAQYRLAMRLILPANGNPDLARGTEWLRKAAESGYAEAEFKLACMHNTGHGMPTNRIEAMRLFLSSAQKGSPDAQFAMGTALTGGMPDVPFDIARALDWFKKAADQGHLESQSTLGAIYYMGRHVAQDFSEAAKWLEKAAQQGEPDAQFNLGYMYLNGMGVQQDTERAGELIQKSAAQYYSPAQASMARIYLEARYRVEALVMLKLSTHPEIMRPVIPATGTVSAMGRELKAAIDALEVRCRREMTEAEVAEAMRQVEVRAKGAPRAQ